MYNYSVIAAIQRSFGFHLVKTILISINTYLHLFSDMKKIFSYKQTINRYKFMFKKKSLNIEKKLLELEHGQYSDTSKQSIVLKTEIILYSSVFHLFVFLPDTVY